MVQEDKAVFMHDFNVLRREIIEISGVGCKNSFVKAQIPASGLSFIPDSVKSVCDGSVVIREKGYLLENNLLKVKLGPNGTIESFYDKEYGSELAGSTRGMNDPVLRTDRGDLWMLDAKPINASLLRTAPYKSPELPFGRGVQREGRIAERYNCADTCYERPALEITDNHPLQCAVQINYEELRFKTRLTLRHDEKLIRFTSRYMPEGRRYRLGVAFPTSINNGRIRHSVPFGHIERPEGEYAVQGWIDYADSKKGLLLLNRGIPGNNVTDNVMLLSLFRGVAMEDFDKKPWYEEGVEHFFEYALMSFNPDDKTYNPARAASLFNRDIECVEIKPGSNSRKSSLDSCSRPFLEITGGECEISCVKRTKNSIIVRLWEGLGKYKKVTLALREKILSCFRTDAVLTSFQQIDFKENNITLTMKPFEIITLKIVLR